MEDKEANELQESKEALLKEQQKWLELSTEYVLVYTSVRMQVAAGTGGDKSTLEVSLGLHPRQLAYFIGGADSWGMELRVYKI